MRQERYRSDVAVSVTPVDSTLLPFSTDGLCTAQLSAVGSCTVHCIGRFQAVKLSPFDVLL